MVALLEQLETHVQETDRDRQQSEQRNREQVDQLPQQRASERDERARQRDDAERQRQLEIELAKQSGSGGSREASTSPAGSPYHEPPTERRPDGSGNEPQVLDATAAPTLRQLRSVLLTQPGRRDDIALELVELECLAGRGCCLIGATRQAHHLGAIDQHVGVP